MKNIAKLKNVFEYINKNTSQILITIAIAVIILYLCPTLIIDRNITNFTKSILTGAFLGFGIAQLNNSKMVDGQSILNCYLGFMISLGIIKTSANELLCIVAYIIIIVCTYYLTGVLKRNLKIISQNKAIILEIISLIIALLALTFQIIEFISK